MELKLAKKRIQTVRQQLKTLKLRAMIVTGVENVRYLTGFTGHDSWLVVLPDQVILITDSRYTEQALGECKGCKVFQRKGGIAAAAAEFIGKSKAIRSVAIEDSCSIATLNVIKKAVKCKVVTTSGLIEQQRAIKTPEEIKAIEKAAKIAWEALHLSLHILEVGMSEAEFCAVLELNMKLRGAVPGFDTIICFGPNASRNHHQPGKRKLKKNDTILIDFGCKYDGYTCDITRCFVVGKPTPYYRKVYEAVAAAQQTAIDMLKPGVCLADVEVACRKVLEDRGVAVYGHGTGHGIGLQVHENPRISTLAKKDYFEPGHIVTIEPGSYVSGKIGVRIEDDILITEKGHKVISRTKCLCCEPGKMPILKIK